MNTTATATATAAVAAILFPHDSASLLYTAARDALDGFRANADAPAALLVKIQSAITSSKADDATKAAAIAAFESLPVAVASRGMFTPGQLIAGDVDLPEAGDAGFTVSLLGFKSLELADPATGEKAKRNGFWGLAIYPAHSIEAAMQTESGKAWLQSLMDKESGLIAFRGLRVAYGETTVADLSEAAFAMPCALSDYTDRTRATGETFATFNDLWPAFRGKLAENPASAKLVAALPTKKADMLAAIRSKTFAEVKFPALEAAGIVVKVATAFGRFVAAVEEAAAQDGTEMAYSAADVARWIEGRDTLDLVKAQTETVDAAAVTDALAAFGIA